MVYKEVTFGLLALTIQTPFEVDLLVLRSAWTTMPVTVSVALMPLIRHV